MRPSFGLVGEKVESSGMFVDCEGFVCISCGWWMAQAARDSRPKPRFDLCICLGGDGTLLHYSSLYETESEPIPPAMMLGLGTLGFISSMGMH